MQSSHTQEILNHSYILLHHLIKLIISIQVHNSCFIQYVALFGSSTVRQMNAFCQIINYKSFQPFLQSRIALYKRESSSMTDNRRKIKISNHFHLLYDPSQSRMPFLRQFISRNEKFR